MKRNILLKLFAVFLVFTIHQPELIAEEIWFKVIYKHEGPMMGATDYMETLLFNKMKLQFPCVKMTSSDAIKAALDESHKMQLVGNPAGEKNFNTLSKTFQYVKFAIYLTENHNPSTKQVLIGAKCIDLTEGKILVDVVEKTTTSNYPASCETLVETFMDELRDYEFCPYIGKVSIDVKSEKEEAKNNSIACAEGSITTEIRLNSNSDLKWELYKNGLKKGSGNVTYDLTQKTETIISNPCYVCKSGDKGFAKITEIENVEAKTQGLSNESVSEGQNVDDCRIRITFLENGTYTILIEATSKKGKMQTTYNKKFEGPCPSDEEKPKPPRTNEIDIPLKVVLGPYPGTAQDKVLRHNEIKDVSEGEEKTMVNIDFNLTREN